MQEKRIGLIEALFGLLVMPGTVAEQLFEEDDPPHVFVFLLLFLVTIFVPLLMQVFSLNLFADRREFVVSSLLAVFFSLVSFVTLETVLLLCAGVRTNLNRTFSVITYSLMPVLIAIWCFYGLNYYFDKSLSIFTIILTDSGSLPYQVRNFLPYLFGIAQIGMLLTFYCCLKEVGRLYNSTAFMLALLSLFPLWISILAGHLVAEIVFPGTLMALSKGFPGIEVVQQIYNYIEPYKLSK